MARTKDMLMFTYNIIYLSIKEIAQKFKLNFPLESLNFGGKFSFFLGGKNDPNDNFVKFDPFHNFHVGRQSDSQLKMVLETIDKENTSNQRVLKPSTPPSKKSTNLLDSVSPKKIVEEIVETESQDDGVPSDEVSEMHPGSPVHNQRANRINQLKQEVTQLKQVKEVEIERKYTHCSTVEDFIPNENWETQDIDDQSSERNYTEEEVKEILSIQADRIKSFEVDLINLQEDCIQYQQEYFKIKEEGCALYEFFISKTNSLKDLKEKYHIICEQYELQRAENNELLLQLEHSNLLASEWKLKHKQQADRFKENIESYKHMKSENHGLKEEIQTLHDKLDRLSSNGSHNNAQSSAQISEVSALNKQLTATIEVCSRIYCLLFSDY